MALEPHSAARDRVTRKSKSNPVAGTVLSVSVLGTRVRIQWDDGTENRMDIDNLKPIKDSMHYE